MRKLQPFLCMYGVLLKKIFFKSLHCLYIEMLLFGSYCFQIILKIYIKYLEFIFYYLKLSNKTG